ncbi:unnamed protein product [Moneuplotes crassus]|uniref:Uncharacterized protein n=1 Tax=Euplotes crassus TaxID=5936 RepID=A0AAD2CWK4_EUPCR|nr:unnamed protein product [Moneuplotes crassus]
MEKRTPSTKKYSLKTDIQVKPKTIHRRIEPITTDEFDVRVPSINLDVIPSLKHSENGIENNPYEISNAKVKKVYSKTSKNHLNSDRIKSFRKPRRVSKISPRKAKDELGMGSSHSQNKTLYNLPYSYEKHNRSMSKQHYLDNDSYISSQTFYLEKNKRASCKEPINPEYKPSQTNRKNTGLNLDVINLIQNRRDEELSKSTKSEAQSKFVACQLNMTQPVDYSSRAKFREDPQLEPLVSEFINQKPNSQKIMLKSLKNNKKTKKLLDNLHKIEEEIDKYDIEYSISNKKYKAGTDQFYNCFIEKCKFIDYIFKKIDSDYKKSDYNSFKIIMTKGKHDEEAKLVTTTYSLCSRIISELLECRDHTESHYLGVIQSKDYTIDNLKTRLKTAIDHLKQIEEDELNLQKDVDIEIKKLEELGNFDDLEKPDFLSVGLHKSNTEDDPCYTLTDIYQFLLFEGEIVKSDAAK